MFCNPHDEKLVPNYEGEVRLSSPQNPIARRLIRLSEALARRAFERRMDKYLRTERELAARVNGHLYEISIDKVRISLQTDDASDMLAHFLGVNLDSLSCPVRFLDSQDVQNVVDLHPIHPALIPGVFHFKVRCQVMASPGQGNYHRISWLSPIPDALRDMGFKDRDICMTESVGQNAVNELGHRLANFMMQIMEARLKAA
jgi:hypothetical protein